MPSEFLLSSLLTSHTLYYELGMQRLNLKFANIPCGPLPNSLHIVLVLLCRIYIVNILVVRREPQRFANIALLQVFVTS
jgi:hypothetical protein